jgi:hypothetical protein
MKTLRLLGPAIVAGAVRYPTEGPIPVQDVEADRLVENGLAEAIEDDDDGFDDDLDGKAVADLKTVAADEKVDLGSATTKAKIIAAIRAHRAAAAQ